MFGWHQTRGAQKGAGARMLHNLRSYCETELMERFPVHVVSKWLGHDTAIALKYYSQTTDEHFAEALGKGGAESGAWVAQKPGKKIVASRSNQLATLNTNTDGIKDYAVRCDYFRDNTDLKAEGEGFEPTDALRHLRFSGMVEDCCNNLKFNSLRKDEGGASTPPIITFPKNPKKSSDQGPICPNEFGWPFWLW